MANRSVERVPIMKSKRIQKLGIAAAVFALLVVVAAVIIPKLIDLNRYRGLIVTELEKAVEGKVEIGSLAWGISNGISVSKVFQSRMQAWCRLILKSSVLTSSYLSCRC